jgi:hypothetical protein
MNTAIIINIILLSVLIIDIQRFFRKKNYKGIPSVLRIILQLSLILCVIIIMLLNIK